MTFAPAPRGGGRGAVLFHLLLSNKKFSNQKNRHSGGRSFCSVQISATPTRAPARCATWFTPPAPIPPAAAAILASLRNLSTTNCPRITASSSLRKSANLGQDADGEQAEDRPGRAEGHRRRGSHAEQAPRSLRQHDVARESRAYSREQVREPHAESALLLLDDLPEHVEEEDVAAEVRPVGVAEDAGDELPPARVHVVQVQRLDEPHVQPLVGDEERDVDEQEEEYAVTLVGLGARPRVDPRASCRSWRR